MPERVLIVEDEAHIAQGLQLNLEAEGFETSIIGNGLTAISEILRDEPDLVLLDVMLPGASGFEVCDRIRSEGCRVPVLFLTVRDAEDDRVRGLELGGDDYLTKPFSLRELLHRVRAILRREAWYRRIPEPGRQLEFGGNRVDFSAYKAWTHDGEVALTQKECMVLRMLVENEGRVVMRDELLNQVWGMDRFPSTRTVDNIILRLRKIFEKDPKSPRFLLTLYGAGYKFVSSGESTSPTAEIN